MSTDLTRTDRGDVGRFLGGEFEDAQKALIRHTIAPSLTPPEFDLFISIAAMYQLNPLVGEIWPAKMPGRNGEAGKFTPIVGRDGFLAIANRHPDFDGFDADVVHEKDTLRKVRGAYEHEYELTGDQPRGKIIGAYATVYRRGRRPVNFWADWAEYSKTSGSWRTNPSAMILKCALANALRLAFNLSGLYVDAEMTALVGDTAPPEPEPVDFGSDELGMRISSLLDTINELEPGKYRPAKLRVMLATATDEERARFADSLEAEIAAYATPEERAEWKRMVGHDFEAEAEEVVAEADVETP